jgi:hypothetical protein
VGCGKEADDTLVTIETLKYRFQGKIPGGKSKCHP